MRSARALGVSLLLHGAFFAVAFWITVHPPVTMSNTQFHHTVNKDIVWLDMAGPGGGGGGDDKGNKSPEPPRTARLEGKDKLSVPVAAKPELDKPNEKKPEDLE